MRERAPPGKAKIQARQAKIRTGQDGCEPRGTVPNEAGHDLLVPHVRLAAGGKMMSCSLSKQHYLSTIAKKVFAIVRFAARIFFGIY